MIKLLQNITKLDQTKILVASLNYKVIKDYIIFLNTEKQIALGLDTQNNALGFYANPEYASLKKQAGGKAPLGVYDFNVTGDYFNTFVVEILSTGAVLVQSDTQKPDRDLRDIVSNPFTLEGLSEKNISLLVEKILPIFINETKKAIFKQT